MTQYEIVAALVAVQNSVPLFQFTLCTISMIQTIQQCQISVRTYVALPKPDGGKNSPNRSRLR